MLKQQEKKSSGRTTLEKNYTIMNENNVNTNIVVIESGFISKDWLLTLFFIFTTKYWFYIHRDIYTCIYTHARTYIYAYIFKSLVRVHKTQRVIKGIVSASAVPVSTHTIYHIYKLHLVCNRNSNKNCQNIEYKVHVWPKTALYSLIYNIYSLKPFI